MTLKDNALKAYLKNVYFLTGTPCAGKTTLSRALGVRHGLLVYDADGRFAAHQQLANPLDQPAMHRVFEDADQFFGRTPQEYAQWLKDNTRQQLDFVLLDLIRLSADRPVLCDCRLTVQEAGCLSEPSRVAFLLRAPARLADDYCSRPDHQDFYRFLLSASNPEAAQSTLRETLLLSNLSYCSQVKSSGYFWLERTDERTVEETAALLTQHFGWPCGQ